MKEQKGFKFLMKLYRNIHAEETCKKLVHYNHVINKCDPAVINSILGDFFVCQVATQMRSFLKPCRLLV